MIVDKHDKHWSIVHYYTSCSAKHRAEILGAGMPWCQVGIGNEVCQIFHFASEMEQWVEEFPGKCHKEWFDLSLELPIAQVELLCL